MANNTYVVDVEAPVGPTITLTDDGTGSDWLSFNGVYNQQTSITLAWSNANGHSTAAAGTYYTDNQGSSGRLVVEGLIENVRGSNGSDYITGNEANNILYGDHAATGPGGNDVLVGDEGNDLIYGGAGVDDIQGDEGNDKLYGGIGNDTISGGSGIDYIDGGAGADDLAGGSDIGDTVSYASSTAAVTINITYGSATIGRGGYAQGDKIYGFTDVVGSNYNDVITDTVKGTVSFNYNKNEFNGGGGNDILKLGGGNDIGLGGIGNDKLYGEVGNDILNGGAGNDFLYGGNGADKLTGSTGADQFIFTVPSDSTVAAAGRDTILDFSRAQGDRINLALIDADSHSTGNQAFHFIGTHAFTHNEGELRISALSDGYLVQADINGNGTADMAFYVDNTTALRAADFVL